MTIAVDRPHARIEAGAKVSGAALYAHEYQRDEATYAALVQAPIASGRLVDLDASAALALAGVIAVLWHGNAPRLHEVSDPELEVLQSDRISYRGQICAAVVADSQETADHAAGLVRIGWEQEPARTELRADDPQLIRPETVNPNFDTDSFAGDVDAALASAAARIDHTYRTPAEHNNPMEPHAATAVWEGGELTLYDSNQGVSSVRDTLAQAFGLEPAQVRVIASHVGGGFGSKGTPRPHVVVAAMAAQAVGRPVKVAITRRQMFAFTGYRTPTIQRIQLGADDAGRLTAIAHDVVEQTSMLKDFAEQTAVCTRMMYASPNRRTTHMLARLNVPTPSWMRAPGECPGMFALESALDELAIELELDPVELRIINDPPTDPETGLPFSSRNLVACLREGAERFGWRALRAVPGPNDDHYRYGVGVAASTYPARWRASEASIRVEPGGGYVVGIAANDIGTGARTALTQIAAEALGVGMEQVQLELGDSALPTAPLAGGSMGTSSWGTAVLRAVEALKAAPQGTTEAHADTAEEAAAEKQYAAHSYGAQFVQVKVDMDTGEVRVPHMLGMFAAGRIVNPATARSQLIGGMTMGLGMALLEESVLDLRHGDYVNRDLAGYHVPVNADVERIDAHWIDERDEHVNPLGIKGIGELGIVGAAAAVANAVHHATGVRVRELPIRPDRLLDRLV